MSKTIDRLYITISSVLLLVLAFYCYADLISPELRANILFEKVHETIEAMKINIGHERELSLEENRLAVRRDAENRYQLRQHASEPGWPHLFTTSAQDSIDALCFDGRGVVIPEVYICTRLWEFEKGKLLNASVRSLIYLSFAIMFFYGLRAITLRVYARR